MRRRVPPADTLMLVAPFSARMVVGSGDLRSSRHLSTASTRYDAEARTNNAEK
ncbi:MAG: hypothetical protein ABR549_12815 [Mycobacteriales bacterium]